MADLFLEAEAGIESNQPREFFDIVQDAATTYRIASGTRDIVYDGKTYTAQPLARTEIIDETVEQDSQLTLALPLAHSLCQRYFAQGSPPRQVQVSVYRQQGAYVELFYSGYVVSVGYERHLAKLLVQSWFRRQLTRKLPVFNARATCPHVLYDQNCRFPRGLGTIGDDGTPITITGFNGRVVTISDIGGEPDQWARGGELVHLPSGERMTILSQTGKTITMQTPIPGLSVGDAVTVCAGCAKDIITCRVKFANQVNFGGFPQLPTKNPFLPTGLGVVEQE